MRGKWGDANAARAAMEAPEKNSAAICDCFWDAGKRGAKCFLRVLDRDRNQPFMDFASFLAA